MNWLPRTVPVVCFVILSSCQKPSPRDTFATAVLNCNLLNGFAGRGMQMQLEQPSIKLAGENLDHQVQMKRLEVVDDKIRVVEEAFGKVRKLTVDEDSRAIIGAATALYEFVLPVYQNEYRKLAELYDSGADRKEIEDLKQNIENNYQPKFSALLEAVTIAGKAYAEKHQIPVQWDIRTSPGSH